MELARRFARDLGARIEWVQGSEEELLAQKTEARVMPVTDLAPRRVERLRLG